MLINENMQRLRKAARLSQSELAQAMTERGRPWHQNTVSRVELGKQEIDSLGDIIVLQEILGPELIEGTPLAQGMDVAARRSFYHQAKTELAKVEHSLRELSDAAVELSEVIESLKPEAAPKATRAHQKGRLHIARELFEKSLREAGIAPEDLGDSNPAEGIVSGAEGHLRERHGVDKKA